MAEEGRRHERICHRLTRYPIRTSTPLWLYPALSVGLVVVVGGLVVVVVCLAVVVVVFGAVVVVVCDDPAVLVVVDGAVVVVVVVGSTNGLVSPFSEARLAAGAAARPVQLCAAVQLCSAVVAGVPVRGWGSPATMVAGRHVAETMCRPVAVMTSEPLLVSGAVLS